MVLIMIDITARKQRMRTMLRHARWAGRRALNGQGMIVFQAAAAFVDHIARPLLEANGYRGTIRERVIETMGLNWGS